MWIKNKKTRQKRSKLKASLLLSLMVGLLFLAFCHPAFAAEAQNSPTKAKSLGPSRPYISEEPQDIAILPTTDPTPVDATESSKQNQTQKDYAEPPTSIAVTEVDKKPRPRLNNLPIVESTGDLAQRRLRKNWLSTLEDKDEEKTKIQLQHLIRQISSVEFRPEQDEPEPLIVVEPEPVASTEPNETTAVVEVFQEPQEQESKPQLPFESISRQTLQMLNNLSPETSQLQNSFELAEVLFRSGYLKEAALCYRQVLNSDNLQSTGSDDDRAWILFQLANCLRQDNTESAAETYKQVIAKYPDSLWAELAEAQNGLIQWYQVNKPKKLIDKCRL